MRNYLDFHPHIVISQPRDPYAGPKGLVIWHVLIEIADHCTQSLIVQGEMVGIDTIHLAPALASGLPQRQIHIGKGLINLAVDICGDLRGLRIPSA